MPEDIVPNPIPPCDLCPRPARVHLTENIDGHLIERHFCLDHARQSADLPIKASAASSTAQDLASLVTAETRAISGMAANLRGTANFIRRHGRPPRTAAELEEGMALRPPFPTADITDPNLLTYLEESDALLEFFEGLAPPDHP